MPLHEWTVSRDYQRRLCPWCGREEFLTGDGWQVWQPGDGFCGGSVLQNQPGDDELFAAAEAEDEPLTDELKPWARFLVTLGV